MPEPRAPSVCFCPHSTPWAGLREPSPKARPPSARWGRAGGAGQRRGGHCLCVLSDPLPAPPTHNPIDTPTPSSGPVTMATVFSVALHQFLSKSFSLPPPPVSLSPPSACISTSSRGPPCPLRPSFWASRSLPARPHPLLSECLSTAPLPSLPFPAHGSSNKLESVDWTGTHGLLVSGPRSREAWRDRVWVAAGSGLRPVMQR